MTQGLEGDLAPRRVSDVPRLLFVVDQVELAELFKHPRYARRTYRERARQLVRFNVGFAKVVNGLEVIFNRRRHAAQGHKTFQSLATPKL